MKKILTLTTTLLLLLGTSTMLNANELKPENGPEWVEEVYDDFAGDGCPC